MITTPTVLILGAGASKPYGFPTGRELLFDIVEKLERIDSNNSFAKNLLQFDDSFDSLISEFRNELNASMQPSVDAFLEKRPEFLKIGKAAIAAALIPYEQPYRLDRGRKSIEWYEYLFQRLATSTHEQFVENRLSVVTFNYDRSLEFFLFNAIKFAYGVTDRKAAELLQCIRVIHVYGQLADPIFFSSAGRNYEPIVNRYTLKKSVDSLKIFHEEKPEAGIFQEIRTLISEVEKVCFLGFGYHETNLSRIATPKIRVTNDLEIRRILNDDATIYGSTYGLGPAEVDMVRYSLSHLFGIRVDRFTPNDIIRLSSGDTLETLRSLPILI